MLPDPEIRMLHAPMRADSRPWMEWGADERVDFLVNAYRSSGGLISGEELAQLIRPYAAQPISVLARAIVCRRVISFSLKGMTVLPMFQFERPRFSVHRTVLQVLRELRPSDDDLQVASWFIRSNEWLHGESPCNLIRDDCPRVVEAARAQRFA